MIKAEEIYTIKETAELLKCSKSIVYRMIEENKLKYFRVGNRIKITGQALLDYINNFVQ